MGDEEYILWQPKGLSGLNPTENYTVQALNPLDILFCALAFTLLTARV